MLFVGCVDGLGKTFKTGVLLISSVPQRLFEGLVLKRGFRVADGAIYLGSWVGLVGLGLNVKMLVMDGMSWSDC